MRPTAPRWWWSATASRWPRCWPTTATPSSSSCAPTCATSRSCSAGRPTTTAPVTPSTTWSTPSAAPGGPDVPAVALTDPALDDLRRAGPVAAALLLGRLRLLEQEPEAGAPLVDRRTGFRILDALDGAARIVHSRDRGGAVTVHEVWIDGVRSEGEAYAEALERVRAADPSEQVALARSVQRLARLTGVRPVPGDRLRAPVPDWLADALVRETGLTRLAVAAMDATTAFDAWNDFLRTSRS